MTSLTTAKHQTGEIDGIRCTIIETGTSRHRMEFLRDLLSFNRLEVKIKEEAPAEGTDEVLYTIGVTDIVFNPVYAIYERTLLKQDGMVVTPAYWRQLEGDTSVQYWTYGQTETADQYE
ncbi:MAG: hypothetical protein MUC78_01985 [Bacteroidales bacterium]|jgi:hypothetical protein|nr:hypothetical protein [Bacteroidales bacterium]